MSLDDLTNFTELSFGECNSTAEQFLSHVYGKYDFIIPKYQRDYSWERDSVDLFLARMFNIVEYPYFLGVIVTADTKQTTETGTRTFPQLQVVDGQQRITTLTLFYHCLFEMIYSGYHNYRSTLRASQQSQFKLEDFLIPQNKDWFLKNGEETLPVIDKLRLTPERHARIWSIIFGSLPYDVEGKGESKKKLYNKQRGQNSAGDKLLWDAYQKIRMELYKHKEKLSEDDWFEWCQKVTGSHQSQIHQEGLCPLHCIFVKATDIEKGVHIFNQINAEGSPLGQPDLIKSNIYDICKEGAAQIADGLMDEWDELEIVFPSKAGKTKTFETFLLHYIWSLYNPEREKTSITNSPLAASSLYKAYKEFYNSKSANVNLLKELKRSINIYKRFTNYTSDTFEETHITDKNKRELLNKILSDMSSTLPSNRMHHSLLLTIFRKLADDSKAEEWKFNKNIDVLIEVCHKIFIFIFRYYFTGKGTNIVRPLFNILSGDIRKIQDNEDLSKFLKARLSYMLGPRNDDEYDKDIVADQVTEDTMLYPPEDIHKKNFLEKSVAADTSKAILYAIEVKLGYDKNTNVNSSFNTLKGMNVQDEHIYPKQNAKWKEISNSDGFSEAGIALLNDKREHIGNRALIDATDNKRKNNDPWKGKKEKLFRTGLLKTYKIIIEVVETETDGKFNASTIKLLSEKYYELSKDIFDFDKNIEDLNNI
jgi:hypothetical protein